MFIYNLEAIAEKLKIDFDKVSSKIDHSGIKGTAREDTLKEYLQKLFPKRYSICNGIIIDSNQVQSKQQDFIIYDSFNCPSFYETETNKVLPIESVYATIEIKSKLTNETLKDSIGNIKSVRSLQKKESPYSKIFKYPVGFVFAYTSDSSLETIQKNFSELNQEILPEHQISIICVLDKGLIFNVKKDNIVEYTIYPSLNTIIGRSESELKNNLYSFYLLMMQYLNSIKIDTPDLLDYAIKMGAFNVGVSIPAELLSRDCNYRQNGISANYGEMMDLIGINKKYPNLFSKNLKYEEFYSCITTDMIKVMESLSRIQGIDIDKTPLNMYGYNMNADEFKNFRFLLNNMDNDDNKKKAEELIKTIYDYYLKSIDNEKINT